MERQNHVTAQTRNPLVAVVGAINMDISARSLSPLLSSDSNPGYIHYSPGGVAYNIARNLTFLDISVRFLTVFGGDSQAVLLKKSCLECGVDISCALTIRKAKSSTYVCINSADGEMVAAINDMGICEYITPEYLKTVMPEINKCELCIADTNMSQSSLIFLAMHCTIPLFVEPVSTQKSLKLLPILGKIHTLTPNVLEAQVLSYISVCSFEYEDNKKTSEFGSINFDALKNAANFFLQQGIAQVYISLGSVGLYCANTTQNFVIPSYRTGNGNTTGAGDSQMAAVAWAYLQKMDLTQSAQAAIAAASICMESNEAINTDLHTGVLNERIHSIS